MQDAPRVHLSFSKPMKNKKIEILCALLLAASPLTAQLTLNPNPSRVIGQTKILLSSTQPNLVEGRELAGPSGVAVDLSSGSPGAIYVADTGNNRVLAWKSATNFTDGAMADAVIGQKDLLPRLPRARRPDSAAASPRPPASRSTAPETSM
jgi:hypothetical protein